MNKIHTDVKQSQKLAEILPMESADMYFYDKDAFTGALSAFNGGVLIRRDLNNEFPNKTTPTWSLAALLDILPKGVSLLKNSYDETYAIINTDFENEDVKIEWHDNPVDACVEMIIKLHELKML